jgi:hypothetical protein
MRERASGLRKAAGVVFLLLGLVVAIAVVAMDFDIERSGRGIGIAVFVVGVVVVVGGAVLAFGHVGWIVDRDLRVVVTGMGLFGLAWRRRYRLDGESHVQLIRFRKESSWVEAAGPHDVYVVCISTGDGVAHLSEHGMHEHARNDAERFAEFLNVPLVDSTQS